MTKITKMLQVSKDYYLTFVMGISIKAQMSILKGYSKNFGYAYQAKMDEKAF